MHFIVLFLFLCFLITTAYLIWIFQKSNSNFEVESKNQNYLFITVLIPFRNEINRISPLIESLNHINYPENRFEIIFIDDFSDDNSNALIPEKYVCLKNVGLGKKAALQTGISFSKGEVIFQTDADCLLPQNILLNINQSFASGKTDFLIGKVELSYDNLWETFQAIEQAFLISFACVLHQKKIHILCNGANLAYKKDVFNILNGFEDHKKLASGDDMLLLEKFSKYNSSSISFQNLSTQAVKTQSAKNWKDFLSQRLRWTSKARHFQTLEIKIVGWSLVLFFSLEIFAFINIFFNDYRLTPYYITVVFLQTIFIILANKRLYNQKWILKSLFLAIIYPFYAFFMTFLSSFGNYSWKNRKTIYHKTSWKNE